MTVIFLVDSCQEDHVNSDAAIRNQLPEYLKWGKLLKKTCI